jgi:hypothetical protein
VIPPEDQPCPHGRHCTRERFKFAERELSS